MKLKLIYNFLFFSWKLEFRMPVYLCKPGWNADEPWRHGVQVYDYPIPIPDNVGVSNSKSGNNNNNTMTHELRSLQRTKKRSSGDSNSNNNSNSSNDDQKGNNTTSNQSKNDPGMVVSSEESINEVVSRRVRHAEVVLVDEVSIKFERYWLRLRWPGPRGGIAGYIALGTVTSQNIRGGTTTTPPTATPRLKDSGVVSSSSTSNDIQAETHTGKYNVTTTQKNDIFFKLFFFLFSPISILYSNFAYEFLSLL